MESSSSSVALSLRARTSATRNQSLRRSSNFFASTGSLSMRLPTFASVLNRKCGSI